MSGQAEAHYLVLSPHFHRCQLHRNIPADGPCLGPDTDPHLPLGLRAAGQAQAIGEHRPAVPQFRVHIRNRGIAHEGGGEAVDRVGIHGVGRGDLLYGALAHEDNLVGDAHGLLLIVGDENRGDLGLLLNPPDLRAHFHAQAGVQIAQRLVQQQYIRLLDQGPGDGYTLLLAAGELSGLALEKVLDLYQPGDFLHGLAAFGPGTAPAGFWMLPVCQGKGDILLHRHMGVQRVVLENQSDVPLFRHQRCHVPAAEKDVPLRDALQSRDHIQGCGFAAAAGAQQSRQLAVLKGHVDPVDRRCLSKPFCQTSEFDLHPVDHPFPPWAGLFCPVCE